MQPTISAIEPQPKRHTLRRVIIIILGLAIIVTAIFFIVQNVQHANQVNDVKTELIKQNKIIKASAVNNVYKQTLPPSVASTKTVKIDANIATAGTSYCISATSTTDTKITYHMDEKTAEDVPVNGGCTSGNSTTTPSVPGNVSIASTGPTDVTVQWNTSIYAADYTVQCATNGSFTAGMKMQKTSSLSLKIDGLTGDTLYYCRVAANNAHGQSLWSTTAQARTSLYSQPPSNMKASIVSSSELSYSWDAVPGAQYYILQYTTDINFMKDVTTVRVNSESGSIKGLQPYTGYFFRAEAVTAHFDQTHAAFSDPAFARTTK